MLTFICILIGLVFIVILLTENKSSASEGKTTKPVQIPQSLYGVPSQLKFKKA
jgi:hypothetical protein